DHGQLIGTADLAFESPPVGSGPLNKTYVFGSPFVDWTLYVSIGCNQSIDYNLPGGPTKTFVNYTLNPFACQLPVNAPLLDPVGPFGPPDQPVQNPKMDGAPLFDGANMPIKAASLTPLISWDPPAKPHQRFQVELMPMVDGGNGKPVL